MLWYAFKIWCFQKLLQNCWRFYVSSYLKIRVPSNTLCALASLQGHRQNLLNNLLTFIKSRHSSLCTSLQWVSSQENISWYQPTRFHMLTRKAWYKENKTALTPKEISSNFLLIILSQEQSGTVPHTQRHKKRHFYLVDDLLINGFQTAEVICCISNMTDETHSGNNLRDIKNEPQGQNSPSTYSHIMAIYTATISLKVRVRTPNLNTGGWLPKLNECRKFYSLYVLA